MFFQLFGYFQSESEEQEPVVGEEISVFTVSARRRVGDAAGEWKSEWGSEEVS